MRLHPAVGHFYNHKQLTPVVKQFAFALGVDQVARAYDRRAFAADAVAVVVQFVTVGCGKRLQALQGCGFELVCQLVVPVALAGIEVGAAGACQC